MRVPSSVGWFLGMALLVPACGGEDLTCGPSTVEKNGQCVPRITSCEPGTVADGAACVPVCGKDQRWDGTQCVASTACGAGTQLQSGQCVPICASTEYWDGTTCVAVPECGPGTTFNEVSGECEPDAQACAPGSSWVDGHCVSDLACGPGTHAENGACVPDGLPTADVPESPDPEGTAEFTLPDEGKTVILGGVVDAPESVVYADWDVFSFHADAGTYLQVEVYSAGALRPAFTVLSQDAHADGTPVYVRHAIEHDGLRTRREVYLPFTGTYELRVSDREHLLAALFSSVGSVPVGGSEFGYAVEVQNLGAPTPKPISSLPATETGDFEDGSLFFFSLPGLAASDVVGATSRGVVPPDTQSDVFRAVMALGADGSSHERVAVQTSGVTEVLVRGGGTPLIVQDHFLRLGDRDAFELDMFAVEEVDCTTGGCETGSIGAAAHELLRWDLAEGDFLTVGAYMQTGNELVRASVLDRQLGFAVEDSWVSPWDVGVGYVYAEEAGPAYLWLREVDGHAVSSYAVDARIVATPLVAAGQEYTNLPVHEMPPYTLRDAGISHIVAEPGQVVFFSGFATHPDGAWEAPQELLMTPRLEPLGPVIDTGAWNFPDGFVTPLFAYVKDEGHYLHYVFDGSPDFAGGTYDTRLTVRNTFALGTPAPGTPLSVSNHTLGQGMALYTFEGKEKQFVEITVTPTLVSGMVPDLWVFNFGRAEFVYVSYRWIADMTSPRLGLIHRETGTSSAALKVGYQSPYDGTTVLLVQTAEGSGGLTDVFGLKVEVPNPPGNDTCAQAGPITLDANKEASFSWNMASATNTVTYSGCNSYPSDGPDTFFSLQLNEGDTVEVEMEAESFSAALYLFTDCASVKTSCRAGAESGTPRRIVYTVPPGGGGKYILGADSHGQAGWFDMRVKVTES